MQARLEPLVEAVPVAGRANSHYDPSDEFSERTTLVSIVADKMDGTITKSGLDASTLCKIGVFDISSAANLPTELQPVAFQLQ